MSRGLRHRVADAGLPTTSTAPLHLGCLLSSTVNSRYRKANFEGGPFLERTEPRYRADHVGSILRSDTIKSACAQREKGEISAGELNEIEDREVATIVRKQEEAGLKLAHDIVYTQAGLRPACVLFDGR